MAGLGGAPPSRSSTLLNAPRISQGGFSPHFPCPYHPRALLWTSNAPLSARGGGHGKCVIFWISRAAAIQLYPGNYAGRARRSADPKAAIPPKPHGPSFTASFNLVQSR